MLFLVGIYLVATFVPAIDEDSWLRFVAAGIWWLLAAVVTVLLPMTLVQSLVSALGQGSAFQLDAHGAPRVTRVFSWVVLIAPAMGARQAWGVPDAEQVGVFGIGVAIVFVLCLGACAVVSAVGERRGRVTRSSLD